ncbi:pyrroloquinoline quinone precursor peptide PqqA [Streptomyces catenulae]|uniref:Coenzyme PQQ synthesis protein A n=1 Tax=Streptomyces catenulae TaxID=66875 RepID=A0ABV2Z2B3_9ACTN|nr:pyrroloquinoline quinone precursor peptide PqqA [Streptomyces catenulae]
MTSLQTVRTPHTTDAPAAGTPATAPRPHGVAARPATTWATPGYTVIDTALEVTAYRLADR